LPKCISEESGEMLAEVSHGSIRELDAGNRSPTSSSRGWRRSPRKVIRPKVDCDCCQAQCYADPENW
jgi:hypothetical protein